MSISTIAGSVVTMLIGLVVVFYLASYLIPEAQVAGDNLSNSGMPLGSLFASGGIVFILIAVAILLFVINSAKIGKSK